jgi:hypothetical protein
MNTEKQFPILGSQTLKSVPWGLLGPHWRQAERNHGQSLERLAQRGGLAPCEALAVIEGRSWGSREPMPNDESELVALVESFERRDAAIRESYGGLTHGG